MIPDVSELERRARDRLSPDVYDFYAGGAGREATLRANQKAWRRVQFLPRVLRDVSAVDTSVVLGGPVELRVRTPLAVAPTAFHRLAHPDGEVAAATGRGPGRRAVRAVHPEHLPDRAGRRRRWRRPAAPGGSRCT